LKLPQKSSEAKRFIGHALQASREFDRNSLRPWRICRREHPLFLTPVVAGFIFTTVENAPLIGLPALAREVSC
jgi:hypothetical protein